MKDKITLKGIKLFGFHGVLPVEQEWGQFFKIDVELHLPLGEGKAGDTDDLKDTVDYSRVYEIVKDTFYGKRYQLLEALAQAVADAVLRVFPVDKVIIRIRKPQVPLGGDLDYAEVEIERNRL